jgi:hypothetical protein
LVINGFRVGDDTLKRYSEPDTRPSERYLAGAAARVRGRFLPAWMSFRGYFLVATDQGLLVYRHHRLTSAPAGLVRRIDVDAIHRERIRSKETKAQLIADIPIAGRSTLRLAFIGADKAGGKRVLAAMLRTRSGPPGPATSR